VVDVEQRLIAEGLPIEEIQALCDVHGQVLDGHVVAPPTETGADHATRVFSREAEALSELARAIRALDTAEAAALRSAWQGLMDVDTHYRRKDNLLFAVLEKAGIHGPPRVMWGIHDEIRPDVESTWAALREGARVEGVIAERALAGVIDMIAKEQQILLPLCRDTLTDADWMEVQRQSLDIGYCLVSLKSDWAPTDLLPTAGEPAEDVISNMPDGVLRMFTGSLTMGQLPATLEVLPRDLTFVDADRRCATSVTERAACSTVTGRSSAATCVCATRPTASTSSNRSCRTSAPAASPAPASGSRSETASCTSSTSRYAIRRAPTSAAST